MPDPGLAPFDGSGMCRAESVAHPTASASLSSICSHSASGEGALRSAKSVSDIVEGLVDSGHVRHALSYWAAWLEPTILHKTGYRKLKHRGGEGPENFERRCRA